MTSPAGLALLTDRLALSRLADKDSTFIVRLLNDADFLQHIGDRGVRSEADAQKYLQEGPVSSYSENGFGLMLISRRTDAEPLGICGLVKRDGFDNVDLGFALLPQFRRRGYAFEASAAVLRDAAHRLQLETVVAIVNEDNGRSISLLTRLGFEFRQMIRLNAEAKEVCLYKKKLALDAVL